MDSFLTPVDFSGLTIIDEDVTPAGLVRHLLWQPQVRLLVCFRHRPLWHLGERGGLSWVVLWD
jgi:hypothetical protein